MSLLSPPFEDICTLLEKVSTARTGDRQNLFRNFFNKYQSNYGPNVFEPLRLIIPTYDVERKYNLKEERLAAVLIKAMVIDAHSPEAQRLKHYKSPDFNPGTTTGNFHLTAFEEIKKRSTCVSSEQTVKDTNQILDKLCDKNVDQVQTFKEILSKFTAKQIGWLIRMILKDLKIHCGEAVILNAFREDAGAAYESNKDLRQIADPSYFITNAPGTHFKLFNVFAPQSAQPFSAKAFEQLPKPVYTELKLDGNRVLMHFDRERDKFFWHSRNGKPDGKRHGRDKNVNEVESHYGSSTTETTRLSGLIHQGIGPKQVILDGEMIAYDPQLDSFLPFGTLQSVSKPPITDPTACHPCYIVFDILMVDNTPLVDYTLQERVKALKTLIKDQGMYMKVLERKELETEQEVMLELEECYRNQQEGLMIKSKFDKYEIAKRSHKWLKLKPEYLEHMRDELDLLVVGVKYGGGRRGGKIASVLCAMRDDRIPDTDPPRFITLTLAGTGLSYVMMNELGPMMKNLIDYDPKKIPEWLIHPDKGGETFDKIVGYQDSIVMKIYGSQIVDSAKFGMQCTFRFPRCQHLRPDKGWQDIETFSHIMKLKEEGGTKRKAVDTMQVVQTYIIEKKNSKKLKKGELLSSQKGLDSSSISQITDIFAGKTFCVINGTKLNPNEPKGVYKDDYDRLIKENGGDYIQTYKTADIIIAGVVTTTTKSIINFAKDRDIILPMYITDCIDSGRLLPIGPKYMFYTSPKTQIEFSRSMDSFGDAYSKKMVAKDLTEVMERMPEDEKLDVLQYRNLARTINERYFAEEGMSGLMFLNTVAYFDFDPSTQQSTPITPEWVSWKRCQEELTLAKYIFEFEGGKVAQHIADDSITHVVMNKKDVSRFEALIESSVGRQQKPRFVVSDWIKMCYDEETLVDDTEYNPKHYIAKFNNKLIL